MIMQIQYKVNISWPIVKKIWQSCFLITDKRRWTETSCVAESPVKFGGIKITINVAPIASLTRHYCHSRLLLALYTKCIINKFTKTNVSLNLLLYFFEVMGNNSNYKMSFPRTIGILKYWLVKLLQCSAVTEIVTLWNYIKVLHVIGYLNTF